MHHVGSRYDLTRGDKPLRIIVVGQEYGHGPEFVTLAARNEMILNKSAVQSRFRAGAGFPARNPHMRGCTNLLRLIFGVGLGSDYAGEFLVVDDKRVHVFECFALVNFLLCSAVAIGCGGVVSEQLGGKPGRSTKTMRTNCSGH